MNLEQYQKLEEKGLYFQEGGNEITTKNDFDLLWNRLVNYANDKNQSWCFRGAAEAKWKMYSSAQRFWMEQDLNILKIDFTYFIRGLITSCTKWNNRTVSTFLENNQINVGNDFALLSYMQHHNLPTPLLDFTYNPFIGLYFAVENSNAARSSSQKTIDSFLSLYAIDDRLSYLKNLSTKFEAFRTQKFADGEISYEQLINDFSFLLIDKNTIQSYRMLNNPFISNQGGLFVLNNHSNLSLESLYKNVMDGLLEDLGEHQFKKLKYNHSIGFCYNIHKSLRNYILGRLRDDAIPKITPEFIYPNNQKMADYCLTEVLEKL
jgi:FRG domain